MMLNKFIFILGKAAGTASSGEAACAGGGTLLETDLATSKRKSCKSIILEELKYRSILYVYVPSFIDPSSEGSGAEKLSIFFLFVTWAIEMFFTSTYLVLMLSQLQL